MKPITREEQFLKALAEGKEVQTEPVTREEVLLAALAKREAAGWNGLNYRPFGEEGGGTILDTDFNTEMLDVVASGVVFSGLPAMVEGETYAVSISGITDFGDGINRNVSGEFTALVQDGAGCYLSIYDNLIHIRYNETTGDWTLEDTSGYTYSGHITVEAPKTVKTIDPKYLPEISSFVTIDLADYGIDLTPYMQSYGYQTGEVEGVGIFDALSDAYKSGKPVKLRQNVLMWLATDIGTMMTDGEGNVTLAMGTVLALMSDYFDEIYVALSKGDGKTTIVVQHNYVPVVEPEL